MKKKVKELLEKAEEGHVVREMIKMIIKEGQSRRFHPTIPVTDKILAQHIEADSTSANNTPYAQPSRSVLQNAMRVSLMPPTANMASDQCPYSEDDITSLLQLIATNTNTLMRCGFTCPPALSDIASPPQATSPQKYTSPPATMATIFPLVENTALSNPIQENGDEPWSHDRTYLLPSSVTSPI